MSVPLCACEDQKTVLGSEDSPSTKQVPWIKLKWLNLVASAFNNWAILPAPRF